MRILPAPRARATRHGVPALTAGAAALGLAATLVLPFAAVAADEAPGDAPGPALPAGPSCPGGALGTEAGAGAVNPLDSRRYVATFPAPGRVALSVVDDATGAVSAPVARVPLPGAPADGGGVAFDADGRLYVVASADPAPGVAGVSRLYRTAEPLAATNPPATALATTRLDRAVERIAFDDTGLLHLVWADGSARVDPVTGAVEQVLTAAQGRTLACGRPSQLTVALDLPEGRAAAADQLRVAVLGDRAPAPLQAVTAGADRGASAEGVAVPGRAYDVALTTAAGAPVEGYDVTHACAPRAGGELVRGDGAAVRVTVPRERFGTQVVCTFTAVPAVVETPTETPTEVPAEPRTRAPERRTGETQTVRRVTERTTDPAGSAGLNLPGGLGMSSDVDARDTDEDTEDDPGTQDEDQGSGMGLGGMGLGGMGGGQDDQQDQPDQQQDEQPEAGADEPEGPLDPVLPNTGGPSALALPIGVGAVVAGSIVLTRRRRTPA